MVKQKLTVINPEGLHMRPAAVFAEQMALFESDIYIRYKNARVNAKSLLSILSACIKCGAEIDIECSGKDEVEAVHKAIELIESGFAEKYMS